MTAGGRICECCGQKVWVAANQLIALRYSKGLSLRDIDGLSHGTVNRIEHGKDATVSAMAKMANAYGITIDELLRLRETKGTG